MQACSMPASGPGAIRHDQEECVVGAQRSPSDSHSGSWVGHAAHATSTSSTFVVPCESAGAWPAGSEGAIPAPADAAKSTKATGDLLRRFKEMGQSMRNDYKEPPPLDDAETSLRACPHHGSQAADGRFPSKLSSSGCLTEPTHHCGVLQCIALSVYTAPVLRAVSIRVAFCQCKRLGSVRLAPLQRVT